MMNIKVFLQAAILLVPASMLSSTVWGQPPNEVQSLKSNESQWNADFARKSLSSVVEHYAEDGNLLLPKSIPVVGRAAIRNVYQHMLADPAFSLHFTSTIVVVSKSGDLGYTKGIYDLSLTSPISKQVTHTHGIYVTTYRKAVNGLWRATLDVVLEDLAGNGNAPS